MRRPGNIKFVKAGRRCRESGHAISIPPARPPAPLTPGPRGTITYLLDVRLKCWYVPKCLDSLSLASPGIVRIRHLSAIGRGRLHCARTESVSNDAGGWGVSPKICSFENTVQEYHALVLPRRSGIFLSRFSMLPTSQ